MALWRATPTVTGDIRFYGHPLGPVTLTPVVERLTVETFEPTAPLPLPLHRNHTLYCKHVHLNTNK